MRTLIILISTIIFNGNSFSQKLSLSKEQIKDYHISSIKIIDFKYNDLNSFSTGDGFYEQSEQKVILNFDEQGFLVKSTSVNFYEKDTFSIAETMYVYQEDSLFMIVTKEFVCSEYRKINVFGPDSTCLPNITFKIYSPDTNSYKLYESDDDLNFYLDHIFFDRNKMNSSMTMYRREMEWLKDVDNIHHIEGSIAHEILNEIFISYTFTGEPYEIEDENGNTVTEYSKGWYEFAKSDYTENEFFNPEEIKKLGINRNQFLLTTDRKTKAKQKIKEADYILIGLNEFILKLNFEGK